MNAIVVPEGSNSRRTEVLTASRPTEVTNPLQLLAEAQRRGAPLEEIRQWMDLRDRWEANESRKAFDAAIAAAKAEIKPIIKKREVDFTSSKGRTRYRYEDLAGIAESIDPILAVHGLSYRHRSQQEGKKLTITCIVSHRDGHYEETVLSAEYDESGNKNSIQGVGSTATYLQRYTLKLALGLSAANDNDGRASDKRSETDKPLPEGYETWKADMGAKADDGLPALEKAWQGSPGNFRALATLDGDWWKSTKAKAAKVAP